MSGRTVLAIAVVLSQGACAVIFAAKGEAQNCMLALALMSPAVLQLVPEEKKNASGT